MDVAPMSEPTENTQELPKAAVPGNGRVFPVNFEDKNALFRAYMPYITHGGLFIKTDKILKLGDEVFLLIKLIDEPEKFTVAGKVIWITPINAQSGQVAGIGVQLDAEATVLRAKIETYLAGALNADRATDTM
jgi:type IV pilus assembly protein PilZ